MNKKANIITGEVRGAIIILLTLGCFGIILYFMSQAGITQDLVKFIGSGLTGLANSNIPIIAPIIEGLL